MSTHLNYYMSMLHFACDCDFRREDVLILDLPLFHVAGTIALTAALTIGCKSLPDRQAPRDKKGDRGSGTPVGRDPAPHMG